MNVHYNPSFTLSHLHSLALLQQHVFRGTVNHVDQKSTRIALRIELDGGDDERVTVILSAVGNKVQISVRDASISTTPGGTTLQWKKTVEMEVTNPGNIQGKEYRAPFLGPTAQSAPPPPVHVNPNARFAHSSLTSATQSPIPASAPFYSNPASHAHGAIRTLPSSRDARTLSNPYRDPAPAIKTQKTHLPPPNYMSTADPSASKLYTNLASVPPGFKSQRPVCLVGIVESTIEKFKTRGTDWKLSVEIKGEHHKLTMNLFGEMDDLPRFSKNEIVVVQNLKMANDDKKFTDIVAVGYKGEYQIARYRSTVGTLAEDNGTNLIHRRSDLEHIHQRCAALANWGRVQPENAERKRRAHRLLSEVVEGEYFDCTVEVLKVTRNDGWSGPPITLQVTDYSVWPRGSPHSVTIAMWDDAGSEAETMNAGEYFHLRNVRRSCGRFEFAKQVESKIVRVRGEEDSLHIVSLIERKSNLHRR
ncbi:hypothetical protein MKEN_01038300 [Mycena kentingensis (nom. inval.)]|nr:hypothetical protein MKEN_01038300 [Mycena kentingensis (nom. inval.)]